MPAHLFIRGGKRLLQKGFVFSGGAGGSPFDRIKKYLKRILNIWPCLKPLGPQGGAGRINTGKINYSRCLSPPTDQISAKHKAGGG